MTTAGFLQACLLVGVFVPLAGFALLVFFGQRFPRGGYGWERLAGGGHGGQRGHGHGGGSREHAVTPAIGEPLAGWIATGAIGISFAAAVVAVVVWSGTATDARPGLMRQAAESGVLWLNLGRVPVHFGVQLDSLTLIMFLMVSLCSLCIHVFSLGYMRGDPGFARFFAFLSLFCFSMLGLVISTNLLFMFVFWELVGVCSYFLIGFWFQKKSASDAAIKAFVVNRVGDFGFMIGLALCLVYLGTLSLHELPAVFEAGAAHAGWIDGPASPAALKVPSAAAERASLLFSSGFLGIAAATWLGIGLFCGAIGKSAQFPLQVWLPDAMEGPTPVSALIHAATMVAAGVYLVARIFAVLTPGAQLVIAGVGCITLTIAALMALVQTDIKRVLAYSTLSQLGYMIFGLGVGAWIGALFHLLTHAFFKALLFLGAGQVIAGCHHEQDLRRMGGLRRRMPRTAWTFLVAVLAISGAGIPYTPIGVGGFFSKDEILAVAMGRTGVLAAEHEDTHDAAPGEQGGGEHVSGAAAANVLAWSPNAWGGLAAGLGTDGSAGTADETGHAPRDERVQQAIPSAAPPALPLVLFILPLIVAYITPFYMGRCYVLAFLGRPRDEHVHAHAHEERVMYTPLIVLAVMTIVSGFFLFRDFVSYAAPAALPLAVAVDGVRDHSLHGVHRWLPILVGPAWVVGLGGAFLLYRDGLARAEKLRALPALGTIHTVLVNKFYFDHVYNAVFMMGTRAVAVLSRAFDVVVIDGIVNASARITERVSRFSGVVLDNIGVDGLVNGVAAVCALVGDGFRAIQTGLARNYILAAALVVAALLLSLWSLPLGLAAVLVGVGVLAGRWVLLVVAVVLALVAASWSASPLLARFVIVVVLLSVMALGRPLRESVEQEQAESVSPAPGR